MKLRSPTMGKIYGQKVGKRFVSIDCPEGGQRPTVFVADRCCASRSEAFGVMVTMVGPPAEGDLGIN